MSSHVTAGRLTCVLSASAASAPLRVAIEGHNAAPARFTRTLCSLHTHTPWSDVLIQPSHTSGKLEARSRLAEAAGMALKEERE